ncbi:MAG: acylneuraminate cytidylyltransferase family protein [Bacteroidetes bacterium]|nr:acylneuraminate cytidylyltransferase family protein [Bacteroidota bacterium]
MNKSLSVFLPTRKGSQRVNNKSTRPFSIFKEGGLLELKLSQLIKIDSFDEIIVSSNDEKSLQIAEKFYTKSSKIRIVKRPDSLANAETKLTELIKYAGGLCKSEHILWTHVTSPFIDMDDYYKSINTYFRVIESDFDSLMSVKKLQTFIWDKESNDIINRKNQEKWPRTQDLKILYEIDSGIFITSKEIYLKSIDRIGSKPYLYEMDDIKSFDIDWPKDFEIAEILFDHLKEKMK